MDFYLLFLISIIIIISISFISMGVYVLVCKKPLIFDARWMLAMVMIIFTPQVINSLLNFKSFEHISFFTPVMYIVLIIFMIFTLKGFIIYGVNAEDFQIKFIENLKRLGFEYTESFSKIIIKEPALEINIALQSWIGSGQIKLKGKHNKIEFHKLIKSLKKTDIKSNNLAPIFYIIIGILILGAGINLF
jgi:hypothetical protein